MLEESGARQDRVIDAPMGHHGADRLIAGTQSLGDHDDIGK